MIRVLYLLWTLVLAIIITGISFFYIRGETRGFPFTFTKGTAEQISANGVDINIWSVALDVIFWWLIFSILWIILKNYIFET
ncbi:MAG: hypothetical protein A2Z11_03650 [Candidatus Woykebacteria bacterium RBG_16_43_9]|uniref:Uncharacterized protein n=1 Tax=Candidatus Woykebacteria bacterium RBG_16_43_9 TaxID=1802596 RepID=A0A1G1WCS7_9BACT|nr:MAG: hypothetical protein A2Z11_03650 [Candidatus Woykebacteria bacterium RBG_16_43_9]